VRKVFLAIAALAVLLLPNVSARADEPVCGSVEAFQRTHRWQDLPGCTEERDYENQLSAVTLLGRAKDAFKDFFENWDKGEIDDAEHAVGGALSYTNGADEQWASDPLLAAARPAYEEMKNKVKQYEEWAPLVKELAQRYFRTVVMIDEAHKGGTNAAQTAKMEAGELKEAVLKAQAARIPDTFVVPGIGEVKPATVAEIKGVVASLMGQAENEVAREKAEDDAKWRPFTSQLGGDRLKFFNETYRIGTNVYGVGGKYLDTPEEFRAAAVMCTESFTTDQLVERWTVRCYSFRGNQQVGGPRVKSGYGSVPSSVYR
jgi:hypothetical protein